MSFLVPLNAIMPLCLMIAIGYLLKQIRFFNDNFVETGNRLCFKLLFPVSMFQILHGNDALRHIQGTCVIFCVAGIILVFISGFLIVPWFENDNRRRGVLIQALFHSNFIVYGTAVCIKMFGSVCEPLVAVLSGVTIPVYNLFSALVLEYYAGKENSGRVHLKPVLIQICKNPLLIGIAAGILFSFTGLKLPQIVETTMGDLAKTATPLALLFLGSEFEFKHLKAFRRYVVCINILRQVVIAGVLVAAAWMVGLRGYELGTVMCIFGAPVAVSTNVLAVRAGADGELASVMIVSTTIVSSVTIFIMTVLLSSAVT